MRFCFYILFLWAQIVSAAEQKTSVSDRILNPKISNKLVKNLTYNYTYYQETLLIELTENLVSELSNFDSNPMALLIAYSRLLNFIYEHVEDEEIFSAISEVEYDYLYDVEIEKDFNEPKKIEFPKKIKSKEGKLIYLFAFLCKRENLYEYFISFYMTALHCRQKKINTEYFNDKKNLYLNFFYNILTCKILDKKTANKHKKTKTKTALKVMKKAGEITLDVVEFVLFDPIEAEAAYYGGYSRW